MTRSHALLAALVAVLWMAGAALAQNGPGKSPLGLPMPPSAEQSQAPQAASGPPGILDRAWYWLTAQQERFRREMSAAVRDLKAGGGVHAAWVLSLIAFIYGVLHAAGPGHGKFVISSYVLASERTVKRGIWLSFLAALFQAISAIAIVGVLAIALNATSMAIKSAEHWIETASWALVAAVGAWMLYGQVKRSMAARGPAVAHLAGDTHHGHHRHHHDHQHAGHEHHAGCCGHGHKLAHTHDHADCCGHAHMPSPKDLEGNLSWSKALAIAGSVGIRPCSGAIIMLIFALAQGLFWAGVLATLAMAIGTAITTSALAALAVGSKQLATRLAGEDSRWATRIASAAGFTGATLVLVMGFAFFLASLKGPAPL